MYFAEIITTMVRSNDFFSSYQKRKIKISRSVALLIATCFLGCSLFSGAGSHVGCSNPTTNGIHSSQTTAAGTNHLERTRILESPPTSGYDWVQIGSDIDGISAGDMLGSSISLSSDGTTVAIGATDYSFSGGRLHSTSFTDGRNPGRVQIFEWSGSDWIQKGNAIDAEGAAEELGSAVAINADGSIAVVGARYNSEAYLDSGQVRVFQWSGSSWFTTRQ